MSTYHLPIIILNKIISKIWNVWKHIDPGLTLIVIGLLDSLILTGYTYSSLSLLILDFFRLIISTVDSILIGIVNIWVWNGLNTLNRSDFECLIIGITFVHCLCTMTNVLTIEYAPFLFLSRNHSVPSWVGILCARTWFLGY